MSAGHVARVPGSDGKTYPTNRAKNREAIRAAIEADPSETNTAIAKRLGTSRDTVLDVRRQLRESTMNAIPEQTDVDVFSLPVHPWAAMFPMRSDDDLAAMAESIKAHGLRMPVVLGESVIEEGGAPTLCVIDGRNRIAACRIAGVKPHTIILNGEDQDAFIADANLERRDLTKGQKAMLVAVRKAKQQGKKSTSLETKEVSDARVSQARLVKEFCPEMVPPVIDGKLSLDDAYTEAQQRKRAGESNEERFNALDAAHPDLAQLVREQTLSLASAESEARDRKEKRDNLVRSKVSTISELATRIGLIDKAQGDLLAQVYRDQPQAFKSANLVDDIDQWIAVLVNLKAKLTRGEQA
ncbi:ParB N-terminal domain-containing protein [Burkholderia sp. JPY481]